MGQSRLRLPLVLFIGLVCGYLNVVGRFFGENHWRAEAVRASCTELHGLFPIEVYSIQESIRHDYPFTISRRSIAECISKHDSMFVRSDQTTWAHVRAVHQLSVAGVGWSKEKLDPVAAVERAEHATVPQHVWHDLFRLTSFVSFGAVGPEHVMVWDVIATATVSCLLAMLLMGLALRRFAPARDPVAVV